MNNFKARFYKGINFYLVWVQEPYISLILELISTLIQKPDKLIQIRILEIYSQLLEQTILEWSDDGSAPSYDNESQKARAQYLRSIIPDLTENILPLLTLPDCELLIGSVLYYVLFIKNFDISITLWRVNSK